MSETYLAPSLRDDGFTGVTGTTPYKPATEQQVASLLNLYNNSPVAGVAQTISATATVINVNFDGTQNNREFVKEGESPTNIAQLSELQERVYGKANTIYLPGIGAQTRPTGTLDENGLPAAGSRPSNWDSIPMNAGPIANDILETAYVRLTAQVGRILADNPSAEISLNLAGASRGGAMATAFANLLKERGIPDLPGEVTIATQTLFDPVDQTDGALNTSPPTNVQSTLVIVAMQEGRWSWPAMFVGGNAQIVPMDVDHCGVLGSWNPNGTQAVALDVAVTFQNNSGMRLGEIPAELRPDFTQMRIYNAGLDKYGNTKWSYSEGARIYEGARLGDPSVQQALGWNASLPIVPPPTDAYDYHVPANPAEPQGEQLTVREGLDAQGRPTLMVFDAAHNLVLSSRFDDTLTQDQGTGALTVSGTDGALTVTHYYSQGTTLRLTTDQAGIVLQSSETIYSPSGLATVTVKDAAGAVVGQGTLETFEDGSTRETVAYADGRLVHTNTDTEGAFSSRGVTEQTASGSIQTITYADGKTTKILRDADGDGNYEQQERIATVGDPLAFEVASRQLGGPEDAGYSTVLIDAETGLEIGAVRIADAALSADDLPDAASPSSTLNFAQYFFESDREFAGSAHEIRSFVGLETPLLVGDDTPSGEGQPAGTVWLENFDTFIGPQVIGQQLAELQDDWLLGTDGTVGQGSTGSVPGNDTPGFDTGVYTIELDWINTPVVGNLLDTVGVTDIFTPTLPVWDWTLDSGWSFNASGSDLWDAGSGLGTYSGYSLFDDHSYDLLGLGNLFVIDLNDSLDLNFNLNPYVAGSSLDFNLNPYVGQPYELTVPLYTVNSDYFYQGLSGGGLGLGGGFDFDLGGGFDLDFAIDLYGPVVLDLDGDGIELVAASASRAWYDLDGKGGRFHTGWVGDAPNKRHGARMRPHRKSQSLQHGIVSARARQRDCRARWQRSASSCAWPLAV